MWNFSLASQEFARIGFVYLWINNVNGKKYIGSHNGRKKNYLSSGLAIKAAFKKYGIKNFTRIFIYTGPFFREVEEEILQSIDALASPRFYNQKNEAMGGSFLGELNGMYGKVPSDETKYLNGSAFRGKKRPDHSTRMTGENNPAFGKNEHAKGLVTHSAFSKGKTYEEIHGEDQAMKLKAKLRQSAVGRKQTLKTVVCPHCGRKGKGPNMSRYHFSKCKKLNE